MIVGTFGLQRRHALAVAALVVLVLAAALGAVPRGAPAQPGTASVQVIVQKTVGRRPGAGAGRPPAGRAGHQGPADRRRVRGHRARGPRRRAGRPARGQGGHPRRQGPGPGRRPRRQRRPLRLPQDDQGRRRLEARGQRPRGHRGRARHRGGQRARPGRPAGPGDATTSPARPPPARTSRASWTATTATATAPSSPGWSPATGPARAASGRASPPRPASCR